MGYKKTDSSENNFKAVMSWAKGVRQRLRLHERSGLLIEEKERAEEDEGENKVNIHNN